MNKKQALLFCSCLICVSCAVEDPVDALACTSVELPAKCPNENSAHIPKATINKGVMKVAPPWICAKKGSTIEFTVAGNANKIGDTMILPEDLTNTWLAGTNSTNANKISVPVPTEVDEGKYKYEVYFNDGKCIDPRVEVVH